jgi:hypothetical protein
MAFNEFSFHCLRSSARMVERLQSIISNHLARAGSVLKQFKRMLHTLSVEPKTARVESAGPMLQHLSSTRHQGWVYLLSGDESWSYLNTDYERR